MSDDHSGAGARAWQRMLTGRRLDLLRPSPADIDIGDIAHGLARVARWNGQTQGEHIFSVAQHSLLVLAIFDHMTPGADPRARLATLLHDAPEYVIGDLISPFKAAIGGAYKDVEARLLAAINDRFDVGELAPATIAAIKAADRIAAYFEATAIAGFSVSEADEIFGRPPFERATNPAFAALSPQPAGQIERQFLAQFEACARTFN